MKRIDAWENVCQWRLEQLLAGEYTHFQRSKGKSCTKYIFNFVVSIFPILFKTIYMNHNECQQFD